MQYVIGRNPILNLDKVIEFDLNGQRLRRQLVLTVRRIGEEISVASPVGCKLANARPGDTFEIPQPEPDPYLVVKVLDISLSQSLPQKVTA